VDFASDIGLLGHSDADVATHAIMDALLGAAALGDIGTHFPPTDQRWAGARSLDLLRQVVVLLREKRWRVGNIDVTIIAGAVHSRHREAPAARRRSAVAPWDARVRLKQALVSRVTRYQSYGGYLTKPALQQAGNARFAFRKNKSALF
jgi:hypothetical protein